MNAKQGQRWGIILVFAGFAIGIPGFWLLIGHARYEATARIMIRQSVPEVQSSGGNLPYDPYFIQTEFEIIQSQIVLGKVVEALHLDEEWGNRYANGRKLEKGETIELLKQCLRLRPGGSTALIEIGVISEDPAQSAKIANAVAETYQGEQISPQRNVLTVKWAEPPTVPIGPNRTLGKALLGVGGLLLGCGFVTFVRNWRRPDEVTS